MIQLLDPKTLWECVCALHYREATKMEARVLSLIVEGYRNDEIAAKLNRSPTTMRRHISELCEKVFAGTDIPLERDKLRLWGGVHQDCCVPLVKEMIENDRKIG